VSFGSLFTTAASDDYLIIMSFSSKKRRGKNGVSIKYDLFH
jgi:hypothetical protein